MCFSPLVLAQVGKHSAAHARAVAKLETLRHVLALHLSDRSSEDLIDKAKRCLKGACTCPSVSISRGCIGAQGCVYVLVLYCVMCGDNVGVEERSMLSWWTRRA